MEILMSELGPDDSTPWEAPIANIPASTEHSTPAKSLQGRGFFSDLGKMRRKPSRADAEPTQSKSCTDKLSMKQTTSILSFPTYHFIATTHNAYLSSLILPAEKYSEVGCTRAFSPNGRLSPLQNLELPNGYSFHPFKAIPLPHDFQPQFSFSKPSRPQTPAARPAKPGPSTRTTTANLQHAKTEPKPKPKPTNLSALSIYPPIPTIPHSPSTRTPSALSITETLLSGVQQGHSLRSPDPKKASRTSRYRMLELGQQIAQTILSNSSPDAETAKTDAFPIEIMEEGGVRDGLSALVQAKRYVDAKTVGTHGVGITKRRVKDMVGRVLAGREGEGEGGWIRNEGDEDWGL
jgi:tRNA-specific adenosine deaminase 1